jgi:Holliday junction resolvase RusA-like endonuclease
MKQGATSKAVWPIFISVKNEKKPMNSIIFTIPGDARGKGRPRATAIGNHARMYTDKATVIYENLVRVVALEAMCGMPPLSSPLSLWLIVRVTPPKSASKKLRAAMLSGEVRPAKKPDLTNIIKAIEDGANSVAYVDDSLIVSIRAEKRYAERAGVDVQITVITSM